MKTIKSKVRIFNHLEHGKRLIFLDGPTNTRDELGKMGVDIHTAFGSVFRDTVAAKVTVVNADQTETIETIYFNCGSLIKYLLSIPHFMKNYIRKNEEATYFFEGAKRKNPNYSKIDFFFAYIANDDKKLIDCIDYVMSAAKENKANKQYQQIYHAGINDKKFTRKTNSFDAITGKFFSWLYQVTIGALAKIKIRFLFANKEKDYVDISQSMARLRFKEAKKDVPAYQGFLKKEAKEVKRFSDIPATSKKNYILSNKDWDTHKHGKYPTRNKTDTSTGTTGKPTAWVRSDYEIKVVKKSLNLAREVEFGDRELHYIDAFALGPWATGLTAYELMRETGSTFACGADIEKIMDNLEGIYQYEQVEVGKEIDNLIKKKKGLLDGSRAKLIRLVNEVLGGLLDNKEAKAEDLFKQFFSKFKDEYELLSYKKEIITIIERLNKNKKQYILAGYPPFLKAVADEINKKDNFAKYHVRGVVGGQGISEAFRDALTGAGFSHVSSSYGASDLDINIAAETDFEVKLRREIEKNPALAHDLFGPNKSAPMVFHYDPFNYLIEADKVDDELYYTCVRSDRSSPRIRYDLGDKGRVYAASDIEAILVKHGITDLKPRINLPFLFIWGRDSAVSFNGSKVAFDDLEHAITTIDNKNRFLKRAFHKYEDKVSKAEKFDILIELNDGVAIPSEAEAKAILCDIIIKMAVHNQDFRSHLGRTAVTPELPRLRFLVRNQSPISEPSGARKQVLVFDKNNLPTGYDLDQKSKDATFSIKKDENFLSRLEEALSPGAKKQEGVNSAENKARLFAANPVPSQADEEVVLMDEDSDKEVKLDADHSNDSNSPAKK